MSNFNPDQLKRARAIAPITSLQAPYSLIRREVEKDVLPYCVEHNIGVMEFRLSEDEINEIELFAQSVKS